VKQRIKNKPGFGPGVAVLVIAVAALVAAAVWQSLEHYASARREYAESTVRRKLLSDLKFLQRSSSPAMHLGTSISGILQKNLSAMPDAGITSRTAVASLVAQIVEESGRPYRDSYDWAFFAFTPTIRNQQFFSGNELEFASSSAGLSSQICELVRLMTVKSLEILFDGNLTLQGKAFIDSRLHGMIDEKTEFEKTAFISSSVRTFQSCFIAGQQYRFMWLPVFAGQQRETPGWLASEVANSTGNRTPDSFVGLVAILYTGENFAIACNERFDQALKENFRHTGCDLKFPEVQTASADPGVWLAKSTEQKWPGIQRGVYREHGRLKTATIVRGLKNRMVTLSRAVPFESESVKLMRALVFSVLLAWFSAVLYFTGNFLVMRRKVVAGLRLQLLLIVAVVLLPAFLQALINMERYLDSSSNSGIQRIRETSEEALEAFDKSVKLYRTRVCAYADDQIHKASHANPPLSLASSEEQHKWLGHFLRGFQQLGVIMKNVLVVNSDGKITSRFVGSNKSEEKFFQQMGSSIFLPTINVLNPDSRRNDDQKILAQAQAEEVLDIMGSILSPEVFPAMANTFARLTRLEGFGDQAFLYHRFFGQLQQIEGALMVAMNPPSLECLAFNRWFKNFTSEDFKPVWLIKKKLTLDWFQKPPFGKITLGGKFGYLRFVYGLLPAEVAYFAKLSSLTHETSFTDFYWNGRNWLFASLPGRDLVDYQLSVLIPLSDHYRHFAMFKQKFRLFMLAIFVLCGIIGWRLAAGFIRPVICFAETSERLMEGDLTARMNEQWADEEFSLIAGKFNLVADDIENGRILRKFVSEGALQTIMESGGQDVKRTLQSRNAVIMFIILEGVWGLSSSKNPVAALAELNRFFSAVGASVRKSGGEVSKFIAEKAMTTFFIEDAALPGTKVAAALEAAVAIIERLQRHKLVDESCRVRAGIAMGRVRSGIIGTEAVRLEQTVIGDAVNLAARLCSQPGEDGILICGQSYAALNQTPKTVVSRFSFRQLPPQLIKGKKQTVDVFSVDCGENRA